MHILIKQKNKTHDLNLLIKFIFIALLTITSFSTFAEKLYLFDIKEQSADKSLQQFGQQAQQTVIYSYALTKQFTTNEVQGYYNKQHALRLLLRNSGLAASINKQDEIKIEQKSFELPTTTSPPSVTQILNKPVKSPPVERIEKISIVGSRTFDRSIGDMPVPVDILSGSALRQTGQVELGRMLQSIAPSFNFSSSSISDGTDVLKPATLRGLGPDQTLILINGKRRHHASLIHINTSVGRGTAGADLNAIPINAIDRIEILRDGAAAQYGSDAIAGVINIVLKYNEKESNFTTTVGQYSQGDGSTLDSSLNYQFNWDNGAFINTTLSLIDHQETDRSGLHGSCQFDTCQQLSNGSFLTTDEREISASRKTFKIGDPAYRQYNFSYNANMPFLTGELYSFAISSNRENDSAAFFRHNANQEANPILSDGIATKPNGYLPYIHSNITDHSFSVGFKGDFDDDLNVDISYSYGKNNIDYMTTNSINASYARLLNYKHDIPADLVRQQLPDSADAYGLSLSLQTINLDLKKSYFNYDVAAGIEFRTDKYKITAGDEYSYFDYDSTSNIPNDNNALGGIQGFPGISLNETVNENRDVISLYFEASTELFDNVNINGAIRFDDYDGFGNTSNAKLAGIWHIDDVFSLRSSISTGFRAPSMQQLYFNNVSTQFIVAEDNALVAEQIGTFRNDSILARTIGIPELIEERSTNFSLGAMINLQNNFQVSLDYYTIHIDDRIVISNKLCADYSPILAQALSREQVDKAQVFLNGADTETQGIDLVATWREKVLSGELQVTVAANYTDTEITKLFSPQSSELETLSIDEVFSEQDMSIIEEWQPKDRVSIQALYKYENWTLNVALNRYGEYTITDGARQTFSPEWLADFRLEQNLSASIQWFLGANNLFDVTPDKNTIGNSHGGTIVDEHGNTIVSSSGVFKYSRRSAPFGFNGRYFYMGFKYLF